MRTCISCQFVEKKTIQTPQGYVVGFLCSNPENIDPVDGSPLPCNVARTNVVFCGIEAKHWKERAPEAVKGTEGKVIQLS